ncbi:DMT family transporter [Azospirillum rugosum]|uniref:Drug/metabolite transporter (DMT)-like permease n=1 Tax=Azospirillum rugosum TaxID=416170 RepID=A0ABS4SQZ6_9PROT|nr:DMT family transporter [Azospirillum rugosum]MBP2294981.1 drug/metabolite transporter (DMT)-like permease [Azospirillum rugosum]MDQ0528804.1 drug/metabolite transporter (DMT)-like permease [Azospirillum rugosum]
MPPVQILAGLGLAVAGVVAFSLRPVIIKLAYRYNVDPVTLIMLRMVFALPFFLGMALWSGARGARAPISGRDLALTVGLGVTGYYAASFCDFLGLRYVSAGMGRLLLFLYPTIVVVLSALFLGKRIGLREVAALVVSYAGVALVVWSEVGTGHPNFMAGAGLVFMGAFLYSVYLVGSSRVVQRIGSMRFTAYAMTAACLCCILQFGVLRPLSALDLPLPVYGLSAVMAVVCTVLPVLMTAEALRRVGPNLVALSGAIGPVAAAVFGYLMLAEPLGWLQLAGAALTVAGVMIITLWRTA